MSRETTHLYFAYGSNLNRQDMTDRCPSAKPVAPALLEGWGLTFRGVADIEPAARRQVQGALWLLSAEDLVSLDRYEGVPSHYERRLVEVQTEEGTRRALTYVMTTNTYLGMPSDWYLGRIEDGFRDWGLSADSLQRAVRETSALLSEIGVKELRPDGRKRMRAVLDERGRGS